MAWMVFTMAVLAGIASLGLRDRRANKHDAIPVRVDERRRRR